MIDNNRLNHSLAVSRKMIEIGKEYNLDDNALQDLFVLGFNHDIGYENGNKNKSELVISAFKKAKIKRGIRKVAKPHK